MRSRSQTSKYMCDKVLCPNHINKRLLAKESIMKEEISLFLLYFCFLSSFYLLLRRFSSSFCLLLLPTEKLTVLSHLHRPKGKHRHLLNRHRNPHLKTVQVGEAERWKRPKYLVRGEVRSSSVRSTE